MAKTNQTSGQKSNTRKTIRKNSTKVKTGSTRAKPISQMSAEELVVENFATLTNVLETLGKTLDTLLQKTENMAHHIIATEEVLAELVATNGINLARVNERIRTKIGTNTAMQVDPGKAIDVAAAIASPRPQRN